MYHSGNQFLRAKEFCDGNDVVVSFNFNSSIIGRQFFKVINAVYNNSDIWLALFPSLQDETISKQRG
jgi:hypothetical protein